MLLGGGDLGSSSGTACLCSFCLEYASIRRSLNLSCVAANCSRCSPVSCCCISTTANVDRNIIFRPPSRYLSPSNRCSCTCCLLLSISSFCCWYRIVQPCAIVLIRIG